MEDLYENKIREGLKELASNYGPDAIIPVTVQTVDTINYLCDCITDDEIVIPDVLYKNFSDGNIDFITQPAVNSRIWIGRIADSEEWIMLKPGKIDAFHVKCGDNDFQLTNDAVVFNGGENGGMVKRDGLISQLNKVENMVKNLQKAMSSWVSVPGDGGAALKAALTTWLSTTLNTTVAADIENVKVKQ